MYLYQNRMNATASLALKNRFSHNHLQYLQLNHFNSIYTFVQNAYMLWMSLVPFLDTFQNGAGGRLVWVHA